MLSYRISILSVLCGFVAVAFVMESVAQGAVLAEDDFTYSDGNVVPNDGGSGWSGPWRVAADFASDASDFGIGGNQLVGKPTVPGVIQGIERPFAHNQGDATAYFGFDLKRYAGSPAGTIFGIGLDIPGGGGPDLTALAIVSGANWFLHANVVSGGVSGGSILAPGDFHRVVGRLDFDGNGANDVLTMWLDPTSENDAYELQHKGQDLGNGNSLDGMTLTVFARDQYADPTWALDNLVLSSDFNSASGVPEPTTLVLLGLGLAGCLASRRRCR